MAPFSSSVIPFASLLLLLSQFSFVASQTCYALNGTQRDSTYAPCNPNAKHSGCCAIKRPAGSVDICLDNGLCMATDGIYMGTIWQDGCTDPTGQDAGCPKMCPDVRTNFDGGKPVLAWNIQMCDYGTYCCREVNDRNNCCNNATAPGIRTNFIGAFQFETSTAGVSSTVLASASATTGTLTQASSVAATAVSTGSAFAQATSASHPLPEQQCKKDNSAIVGGVLGSILGAAVIGLLGVIFWMHKREKHQRKLKEHYEAQFGQNWAYRRTIIVEADSTPMTPSDSKIELVGDGGLKRQEER